MSNEENLKETETENTVSQETSKNTESVAAQTPDDESSQAQTVAPETAETPSVAEKADVSESAENAEGSDVAQTETTEKEPVAENADGATQKAAKPKKQKPAGEKRGMSKLFKLMYYPVLALVAVVMLVFSIIDGVYGYSPSAYDAEYYKAVNAHIAELSKHPRSGMSSSVDQNGAIGIVAAREYIVDKLVEGGFKSVDENKPEEAEEGESIVTVTDWSVTQAGTFEPTVTLHTATPSIALQDEMGVDEYLAGYSLTNIVAAIPCGKNDADSIVVTVRYDTRTDTVGAADNAAFVANVMQSLIEYVKNGVKFENDLIVVFTEDLDSSFGAYAFFDSFKGLRDTASRAKAGLDLEAFGNAGTLAITNTDGAGLDYINAVTGIAGGTFVSSIVPDSLPDNLAGKGSVEAFGDVPAVQIAVLGGLDAAQSSADTAENISQSIIRQQAQLFKNYADKFAGAKVDFDAKSDVDTVFFSYLDGGSIAYTDVASYVIGALILALIGVTVALTVVKKTFSFKNMMLAAAAQLLVIISSLIAMFAAYFLVTLMLTGFGVLPIHAITRITYFNAGIIIAAMLVSLAAAFGFTILYKKLFKVTSSDTVRGAAMLFGLVGAVMSFACPAYSFITSWLGLLSVAVLLVTVCLHKTFKNKFGFGMDRLYLYVLPAILCMPLVISQISMLMWLLPLVLVPVVMIPFTGMLGFAVPYLDRTRPVFDKLAKKLPMRTQRVERVVTERVEDKAKKGKFTEKTFKRIEKEKIPVNYKNYFGVSLVAVLGIVVALFSGGFGVTSEKTLTEFRAFDDAVYNNALVYESVKDSSGNSAEQLVIDDLMLYKYARYSITGLSWDGSRYVKTVKSLNINEPKISKDGDEYTVTTYEGAWSTVTLTIPSARAIKKITIKEQSKSGNDDYEGYVYEFENQDTITLRLPYGFDNSFIMTFDGNAPSRIDYEEKLTVSVSEQGTALDPVDDWNKLKRDFEGTTVYNSLRGAIVIKRTINV